MFRRPRPSPFDDTHEDDPGAPEDLASGPQAPAADLGALPVVGLTRRRIAILASAMLAAWIVLVFVRQIGEASAATTRAEDIAAGNAELQVEVAALERELDQIGRQRYLELVARAYGLGGTNEIPFSLAPDPPPLPADAPGSAAVRLGATDDDVSPLERWLTVLFGPAA